MRSNNSDWLQFCQQEVTARRDVTLAEYQQTGDVSDENEAQWRKEHVPHKTLWMYVDMPPEQIPRQYHMLNKRIRQREAQQQRQQADNFVPMVPSYPYADSANNDQHQQQQQQQESGININVEVTQQMTALPIDDGAPSSNISYCEDDDHDDDDDNDIIKDMTCKPTIASSMDISPQRFTPTSHTITPRRHTPSRRESREIYHTASIKRNEKQRRKNRKERQANFNKQKSVLKKHQQSKTTTQPLQVYTQSGVGYTWQQYVARMKRVCDDLMVKHFNAEEQKYWKKLSNNFPQVSFL